jgi:predicted metal-dependent hydrolase
MEEMTMAYTSDFIESEVDGIKVVQVNVDSGTTKATIKGNKLLIIWDPMYWEDKKGKKITEKPSKTSNKFSAYTRFVKWGVKKLVKKQERIETKKEWTRTKVNGYYVYDVEGKNEVAEILAKIDKDVKPILRHFKIDYTHTFETLGEGYSGFNKRSFGADCIGLNVRQHANNMKLKKYSAVMYTMLHELAHCRHRNHRKEFYDFMNEIVEFARKKGIYNPA